MTWSIVALAIVVVGVAGRTVDAGAQLVSDLTSCSVPSATSRTGRAERLFGAPLAVSQAWLLGWFVVVAAGGSCVAMTLVLGAWLLLDEGVTSWSYRGRSGHRR